MSQWGARGEQHEIRLQASAVGPDVAFKHDLRQCRYLQITTQGMCELGTLTAQQSGKLVFGQAVRHWRDGTQHGGRVSP